MRFLARAAVSTIEITAAGASGDRRSSRESADLFAGLKVAVTLAVTGAVVGEFVGANEGLGYVILQANGNLDTPMLFAGLLIMSLLGVVLFAAVELAEKVLLPWHASRRADSVTTTF